MYGADAKKQRPRYGYEDTDDSWRRSAEGDLRMTVGMHHESPAVLAARRTVQYLKASSTSASKAVLSSEDNRSNPFSRDYNSGIPLDDDDYDLYGSSDGRHGSGGHVASSTMHTSRNSMREDSMDRDHGGVVSFVSNRSQYTEVPLFNVPSNQVWVESGAGAGDNRSRMLKKRPAEDDRSSWPRSRIVLPTYAGTSDPKAPSAFVVELQSYAEDMGYGEMELLNSILPNCMVGEAFQWLSSHRGFKSWEDFRRTFTLRFQPVAYPKRRRTDIEFRAQDPEESLTEFIYAVDAMFNQINPFASDAEKVQRVLQSANPRIQSFLLGRNYQTIWEIAADAPMIEKSLQAQFSFRSPVQTQVHGMQRAGMGSARGGMGAPQGGMGGTARGGKTRWDNMPATTVTVRSREQWKPQNPTAALAAAKARIDRIVAANKMSTQSANSGFSQKQQGKGGWNSNKNASQKQVAKPAAASKTNQLKLPTPAKKQLMDRRGMPPLRKAVLCKGRAGVWVRDADVQVSPRLRSVNTSADLVPEQDSVGAPVLDQTGGQVLKMKTTYTAGMENVRLMWLRPSPPRAVQPNMDAGTVPTSPHSATKAGTRQRNRKDRAKPSTPANNSEVPPQSTSTEPIGDTQTSQPGETQPIAAQASQTDPTAKASVSQPDPAPTVEQPAEPVMFKKPAPPVEPPTNKEAQVPEAPPVKSGDTKTLSEQTTPQQAGAVPAPAKRAVRTPVAKKAATSKPAASKETVPIEQSPKRAPVEPAVSPATSNESVTAVPSSPVQQIPTEAAPGMLQAALSALASQFASGPMAPVAQQMLQMQAQMLQMMFNQGGGGGGGGPSNPLAFPLVVQGPAPIRGARTAAARSGRRADRAAPVQTLPPPKVVVKQEVMDVDDDPEPAADIDPEPTAGNEQPETAAVSDAQEAALTVPLSETTTASGQEPDERQLVSTDDQEGASDGDREANNDDGQETINTDERQPSPADEGEPTNSMEPTDPVENEDTEDCGADSRTEAQ